MTAVMMKPASNVRSPTDGTCLGTRPTYSVWLENSHMDRPIPAAMATGPAQFSYFRSKRRRSMPAGLWPRRSIRLQNITASHGAIQ
jgi:hypothetical protein